MASTDRPTTDALGTLQNVVASAAKIAQDLLRDPLVPRLLDVFARMPQEDRETIVNVLEREVDLRLLSTTTPRGPLSGVQVTKPNPNARLYLRVTDNDSVPAVAPEDVVRAVMRGAQVMHRAFERRPDMREQWEPAIRTGLQEVDAAERETLRWYHARMLELVNEAERDAE